jgi:hypothetical protein
MGIPEVKNNPAYKQAVKDLLIIDDVAGYIDDASQKYVPGYEPASFSPNILSLGTLGVSKETENALIKPKADIEKIRTSLLKKLSSDEKTRYETLREQLSQPESKVDLRKVIKDLPDSPHKQALIDLLIIDDIAGYTSESKYIPGYEPARFSPNILSLKTLGVSKETEGALIKPKADLEKIRTSLLNQLDNNAQRVYKELRKKLILPESEIDLVTALCELDPAESFCPAINTVTVTDPTANQPRDKNEVKPGEEVIVKISGSNLPTENPKIDFGAGITIKEIKSSGASEITVVLAIDSNAQEGPRTIKISTQDDWLSATKVDALLVTKPTAKEIKITKVDPPSAKPGEKVTITITGENLTLIKNVISELFPKKNLGGKLKISDDGKTLTIKEITIPKGAEPKSYEFALLGEKDKELGKFSFEVLPTSGQKVASFLRKAGTEGNISLGLNSLDTKTNLPPAAEDILPHNLDLKLEANIPIMGPKGFVESNYLKLTINPYLIYEHNFHLDAKDSYQFQAGLNNKLQLAKGLSQYFQPFIEGGIEGNIQQYKNPTLFYPDAHAFSLRVRGGFQSDLYNKCVSIVASFMSGYSWFNKYRFESAINNNFNMDGANQELGTVNLKAKVNLRKGDDNPEGIDHPLIPNLTLEGYSSVYGKRHMPKYLAIDGNPIWNMREAVNLFEWGINFFIDTKYLSFFGGYSQHEVASWAKKVHGYGGFKISPAPDWNVIFYDHLFKTPTDPGKINVLQVTLEMPYGLHLNIYNSFGDASGYGITGGVDIMRLLK